MSGNMEGDRACPPLFTQRQASFISRVVPIDDLDSIDNPLGFQARVWAQVSLPYRNPGPLPFWERKNGSVTLVVQPALLQDRDRRTTTGYPYGLIPRLLMTWMATEAVRTKSRQIFLGPSLSQFLKELGMGSGSGGRLGNITRLRTQIQRLAGSRLTVIDERISEMRRISRMESVQIATGWDLWLTQDEDQQEGQHLLWPSSITLSHEFYDSILAAPVPVNLQHLAALRALRGSGLSIDIYTWLAWRMFGLTKKSTLIPWERLAQQFGTEYRLLRQFKAHFLKQLRPVTVVYPRANVQAVDSGLLLSPSPLPA